MKTYEGHDLFHYEDFPFDYSISDCLHYAFGDLLSNTTRGAVAEFIVAKALDLNTDFPRRDWESYDLIYNGKRIEVKASSYLQSWNIDNDRISKISFSIRRAGEYNAESGKYSEKQHNSDIYIFCVLTESDWVKLDVSDLSQWRFYAVPTRLIDSVCGNQSSISLSSLLKSFSPVELTYYSLKFAIDNL